MLQYYNIEYQYCNNNIKHTWYIIVLFIIIVNVTSFDYIWLGSFPLWLFFGLVVFYVSMFDNQYRLRFIHIVKTIFFPIIFPWIIFIVVVLILETANYFIAESFSNRFLLNSAALFLMVSVATWSSLVRPSSIVYIIALIVLMQGILCIAQYLGVAEARTLPDVISSLFGRKMSFYDSEVFKDLGRVRGTNMYVHKFNVMQGILVAYIFVVLVNTKQWNNNTSKLNIILLPALAVGLIGMVLTFSRSTIIGIAITIMVVLATSRKNINIFYILVLAIIIVGMISVLNITERKEFNRILKLSPAQAENANRLEHIKYSLNIIRRSPVFTGEPTAQFNSRVPIHSVALRILVNYGVLGFIPYILVIAGFTVQFLRGVWRGDTTKVFALSGICAFIVAIIDGWTHSSGLLMRDICQPVLLGAFLGMIIIKPKYNKLHKFDHSYGRV